MLPTIIGFDAMEQYCNHGLDFIQSQVMPYLVEDLPMKKGSGATNSHPYPFFVRCIIRNIVRDWASERLRVYQQRCEFFETAIHAYTSAHYAWDEPCYPHRLVVEVPGERILGTYTLDSVQEYLPVYLLSNSEIKDQS